MIDIPAILLLTLIVLVANSAAGKCVLGDGLLNSLVENAGVQQKDEYVAEENVLGWSSGPLDGISTNLTEAEINDCLQEYENPLNAVEGKPLPPGLTTDNDPSRRPYLPPAFGKDVLIDKGNGRGEYYTTYDGSKYMFKEKGYVIDPPEDSPNVTPPLSSTPRPSKTETPKPKPSSTSTKRPQKGTSKKNKDKLQAWYKAFVSVASKYL